MSKRCWLHRWKFLGFVGILNVIEECEKCGRQRVSDCMMGNSKIYPAGTWKGVEE